MRLDNRSGSRNGACKAEQHHQNSSKRSVLTPVRKERLVAQVEVQRESAPNHRSTSIDNFGEFQVSMAWETTL